MLDIGNGGIPHFRAASGSHFQTICWKWKKSRKAPFPDFQGHFTNMKAGPGRFDVADARDAVEVEEFSTEYKAFGRARELLQKRRPRWGFGPRQLWQRAVWGAPAAEAGFFRRIEGRPRREVQPAMGPGIGPRLVALKLD